MDASGNSIDCRGDQTSPEGICIEKDNPPILSLKVATELLRLRAQNLCSLFQKKFNKVPDFYVRVPGRVNIIGEHIDYCGYGVLPLAIQQDMLLAVAVDDLGREKQPSPIIRLTNYDDTYPDFTCFLNDFKIHKPPSWYHYFLCGVRGILQEIKEENLKIKEQENGHVQSMYVAVHGTIPPCSGLSSSSALVSAAALATAHAQKVTLDKLSFASLCAKTERYVGTEGGGMDQAIAFLATKGCAKFIEFQPLRCRDVRLPSGAAFVIAHSLVTINKAAGSEYNTRVVECRLAAQIVAKEKGLEWSKIRRLEDLHLALSSSSSRLNGLEHALSHIESCLHDEPYSKSEVLKILGVNEKELKASSLSENTTHLKTFKLKQRALHVFQEAIRVLEFEKECINSMKENSSKGEDGLPKGTLERLGMLMNSSHSSLRDLYECSHPQLDQLVEICQEKCYGARLTGAGWGGFVVALTNDNLADEFIDHLKKNFYSGRKEFKTEEDLNSVIFRTSLESGAAIFDASEINELSNHTQVSSENICINGN